MSRDETLKPIIVMLTKAMVEIGAELHKSAGENHTDMSISKRVYDEEILKYVVNQVKNNADWNSVKLISKYRNKNK